MYDLHRTSNRKLIPQDEGGKLMARRPFQSPIS